MSIQGITFQNGLSENSSNNSGFAAATTASGRTYMSNCIFTSNKGGVIVKSSDSGSYENLNIYNNEGNFFIGGFSFSNVPFKNIRFSDNKGGLFLDLWNVTIKDSIFDKNTVGISAAWKVELIQSVVTNTSGTAISGAPIKVLGSLLANNERGASVRFDTYTIDVENSIFFNNAEYDIYNNSTSKVNNISHSFIELGKVVGLYNENSSYNGLPGFVDELNGNYRLSSNSQLIDKGNSVPSYSLPSLDLDNNLRVVGDSIDIGPYELN